MAMYEQMAKLWKRASRNAAAKQSAALRREVAYAAAVVAEEARWFRYAKRWVEKRCGVGPLLLEVKQVKVWRERTGDYTGSGDGIVKLTRLVRMVEYDLSLPGLSSVITVTFTMAASVIPWLAWATGKQVSFWHQSGRYETLGEALYGAKPKGLSPDGTP